MLTKTTITLTFLLVVLKAISVSAFTLQYTSRNPSTFQLRDQDEDPRNFQPYPTRIHHHHHHHHYHDDDDDFDHSEGDDYYLFNHDNSCWYPNHYHYFDYEPTSYPIHSHDFYHYHSNSPIVASELEERAFKEKLQKISKKIKTGLKALNPLSHRPAHPQPQVQGGGHTNHLQTNDHGGHSPTSRASSNHSGHSSTSRTSSDHGGHSQNSDHTITQFIGYSQISDHSTGARHQHNRNPSGASTLTTGTTIMRSNPHYRGSLDITHPPRTSKEGRRKAMDLYGVVE